MEVRITHRAMHRTHLSPDVCEIADRIDQLPSSCPTPTTTRARHHRPLAWVFLLFHVTRGSHQTPALARYRSCSITHFYIHHHTHLTFCNRHVPIPMLHRCARWIRTKADGAWVNQVLLAIPIFVTRIYYPLMITSAGRQDTMNDVSVFH
jgi:hypothetical protein